MPQGTVDNNVEPDRSAGPMALISQLFQKTNPMVVRLLYESPNCAR